VGFDVEQGGDGAVETKKGWHAASLFVLQLWMSG